MPRDLIDVRVDEISLVGSPAVPDAKFVICKARLNMAREAKALVDAIKAEKDKVPEKIFNLAIKLEEALKAGPSPAYPFPRPGGKSWDDEPFPSLADFQKADELAADAIADAVGKSLESGLKELVGQL